MGASWLGPETVSSTGCGECKPSCAWCLGCRCFAVDLGLHIPTDSQLRLIAVLSTTFVPDQTKSIIQIIGSFDLVFPAGWLSWSTLATDRLKLNHYLLDMQLLFAVVPLTSFCSQVAHVSGSLRGVGCAGSLLA